MKEDDAVKGFIFDLSSVHVSVTSYRATLEKALTVGTTRRQAGSRAGGAEDITAPGFSTLYLGSTGTELRCLGERAVGLNERKRSA